MVTMSTGNEISKIKIKSHLKPLLSVGYGDITCETEVGRVFQLMFLAVGLVSLPNPKTSPENEEILV